VVVACARKLHDLSFAFPALVRSFRFLQRAGINVTPNHYYYPVPDLAQLEKREWPRYSFPPGCRFNLQKQVELAWELAAHYGNECRFTSEPRRDCYHYNNGYFESVDAEMAYCMVREFKPARVVEIGTGYSTRVLAAALQKNAERDHIEGKLISVDPYPERFSQNGWRGMVLQVPKAVQDLDLNFFNQLESGDILFIDSSHVVGTGSDVVREYLEILPRLKPGVIVHIHDIFLPADYPRDAVLNRLWFWSEQYLLQAFLSFNNQFEVLWASSAMYMEHPQVLEHCFPRWRQSYINMPESKRRFVPTMDHEHVWPSSFWMRRV
jgi:predicted O-methyltransferase YrrM